MIEFKVHQAGAPSESPIGYSFNDFVMFEGGDDTDGFLGYMLSKTPIGKRNVTDKATTGQSFSTLQTTPVQPCTFPATFGICVQIGTQKVQAGAIPDLSSATSLRVSKAGSDPLRRLKIAKRGGGRLLGPFRSTAAPVRTRRPPRCSLGTPNTTRTGPTMLWSPCWQALNASTQTVAFVRNKTASNRTKPECNLPNSDSRGKFSEEQVIPKPSGFIRLGFPPCLRTQPKRRVMQMQHTAAKFELDPLKVRLHIETWLVQRAPLPVSRYIGCFRYRGRGSRRCQRPG